MDTFTDMYERRKSISTYWHNKASDLHASAGVLWAAMEDPKQGSAAEKMGLGQGFAYSIACWPVYQMLCGMSLELLLKAIVVARNEAPKATHDLVALSRQADVAYSKVELTTLKILSESIIWDGRYPVPKKENHFKELTELTWNHLYDPVPNVSINLRRPNDRLDWKAIGGLWRAASDVYWTHCE